MQIFQELELIPLNGIWVMELSLLIRLPFHIVIQLKVFIQLRSFAWDLTCNISDTIYDTLHFITTLSYCNGERTSEIPRYVRILPLLFLLPRTVQHLMFLGTLEMEILLQLKTQPTLLQLRGLTRCNLLQ